MVQLTRIYTKGGDKGKTSLGSGSRVEKFDDRIEAIGTVDEANAAIGLIQCTNASYQDMVSAVQHDLFDVGGDLCFREENKPEGALTITENYIDRLEGWIDQINQHLDPLQSFILPGGSDASQKIHLARTIVRRAERRVALLADNEAINDCALRYLNRLSDFLFVLARAENDMGKKDVLWQPGRTQKASAVDNSD